MRLTIFVLACVLLLLVAPLPAAAEPVSTAIGLTALITSIGVSTAVAGAVGGAIVGAAISVGVSVAASYLAPRPSIPTAAAAAAGEATSGGDFSVAGGSFDGGFAPQTGGGEITQDTGGAARSNTVDIRYTTRQPIPPRRVILGRGYVGGALFFEQVKPPYLYYGMLINHGVVDAVEKIWIGTNELSFSYITPDTVMTPISAPNQPDYPSRLRVSIGYGASTQALDGLLAAAFTSLDAEFRQRGIARAVFRFDYGADYPEFADLWGQVSRPNVYILARGVVCYDPRDPTQSLGDESTWTWTNNASLIQAYYLTRSWGGRIPTARVDWDKVSEAADYDDEGVPCADGTTIKRYTIDGVVTLDQRPIDVLTGLLTANRGYVLESGRRVWVSSSKPRTPIATIHDGILAGGVDYRAAKPKRDLVNKLHVRFVAAEQNYQTVDGPIRNDTDLQASDGEVLTATLSLPFTLDHRRAQRLQKAYMATARLGRTVSCRVDVGLLAVVSDELVGNAVTFASELFAQANGTYLVTSVSFADGFSTIELSLTEYDSTIETDWDASVDEQPFVLADLNVS